MEEKPDLNFEKKIKLDYSPIHNRGIFAIEDIAKDELIEICPMVILNHRMNYHHDPAIRNYCFTQTCPCDECKNHGGHFLMVLGYGQIYNHHDDNNARINFDLKNSLARVHANREIKKGEEIFISYGEKYFKSRKNLQKESTVKKEKSPTAVDQVNQTNQTNQIKGNVFEPI